MDDAFNVDEIFEVAKHIERNGARYYRRAAELITDARARQMLVSLAQTEQEHERKLDELCAQYHAMDGTPDVFDPDKDTAQYLLAIANGHVFDVRSDPAASLTGKETIADILQRAVGMERDSVAFYAGLRDLVRDRKAQQHVEAIAREEMAHINLLRDTLDKCGT